MEEYLLAAKLFCPRWDAAYAGTLLKKFGLDTKKRISKLSKGQMSMVTITAALASRAPVTILDEPAAGMNPNETGELMDMIRFVREEFHMTILLIEHDMKLVSGICERLTVLNFGQVLANGDTEEVLKDPKVITAYLGE